MRALYGYGWLAGCNSGVTISCSSIPSSGGLRFGLVERGKVCGLAMRVFGLIIYFPSEEHFRWGGERDQQYETFDSAYNERVYRSQI